MVLEKVINWVAKFPDFSRKSDKLPTNYTRSPPQVLIGEFISQIEYYIRNITVKYGGISVGISRNYILNITVNIERSVLKPVNLGLGCG